MTDSEVDSASEYSDEGVDLPRDLLGTIGRNLGFAELLPHSRQIEIGGGIDVWVLDLETIIAVKEQLATDKDRAVLPILYQTLKEANRKPEP